MITEFSINVKINFTIFNHFDFNSEKLIVIDSKNNWTWSDLFNRSKYYSNIILNNFRSQKKVIPILVSRSGETIAANSLKKKAFPLYRLINQKIELKDN